jgi:putative transposase
VELVFDPFDLTTIEVRVAGVPAGTAIPHHIGRHAHPKARPETPVAPPPATGIDYARLLDAAHQAELARGVNYAALADPADADRDEQSTHDLDQPRLPFDADGQVRG